MGDYTFEEFSEQPFYRTVNAELIAAAAELGFGTRIVEIASGTGAITEILAHKLSGVRGVRILAVEPDATAVEKAKQRLATAGLSHLVEFIPAAAEQLVRAVRGKLPRLATGVFLCNAIHMIEDKASAIRNIHEVLRPGGLLAINSAFFEGCEPVETARFYRSWIGATLREARDAQIPRSKGEKAAARRQLTSEQYVELLSTNGFEVVHCWQDVVQMTPEGFEAISSYGEFAKGAVPGIHLEAAVRMLRKNVRQAFGKYGLPTVSRRWLQLVAVAV